jgi:hypothetical protein
MYNCNIKTDMVVGRFPLTRVQRVVQADWEVKWLELW